MRLFLGFLLIYYAAAISSKTNTTSKTQITLYNNWTIESSTFHLSTQLNEPNLSTYTSLGMGGEDFRSRPGCYTGNWILYDDVNYTKIAGYLEHKGDNYCSNSLTSANRSSVKIMGRSSNPEASTLNLFSETHFEGTHEVIEGNVNSISNPFLSIFKTGAEPWTIYQRPNHFGFRICIQTALVRNITSELGVLPGDVKSARPGCHSKIIYSGEARKSIVIEHEPMDTL